MMDSSTGELMNMKIISAYDLTQEIRELFTEYTELLIEGDAAFKGYLEKQNYNDELNDLEIKYGLPYGRLYVAYCDETLAGCIGLKKINEQHCEMKRLYVRPQFRGKHLGNLLVERIIKDAKEIGYSSMFLDTLPFLQNAIHMYKKFGFYEIESYNNSPMDNLVYLKLDLQ